MTEAGRCPRCGAAFDGGALFCPRCGVDVSGTHTLAATAPMPTTGEGGAPRIQVTMRQTLRDATLGEYEILAELGRGGMATVFLAHEIALDRKVAIKVMAPHLLEGEGMVERFKLEARTAAQLSHPHIIPIYAVRETESTIFFVMKFIEGRGLDTIIKKLGPLPIPMVKDILTKVGGALGYAHRRDVVHRDVKPSNVMIDEEGTPIMTDFGIAKVAEAQGLTITGTTIGTPSYMSPEQCEGRPVTGASDQYSLGIVAFEMLTGKLPFVGESAVSTMYKHCHEELPPLRDFRPDCPAEIVETVTRMLAKDPADRWPSLEAAVQKLGTQSLGYFDPVRTQLMELAKEGGYRELLAQIQTPRSPVPHVRGRTADPTVLDEPRRAGRWAAAAAVVLVLGGGALAVLQPWQADPAVVPPPDPLSGAVTDPAAGAGVVPETADGAATATPADAGGVAGGGAAPVEGAAEPPPRETVAPPPSTRPATEPAPRAAVASVRLDPATDQLVVGQSVVLAATPFDAANAALLDRAIQWASNDPSVARVDANGRVTGVAPGSAVISASAEGRVARHGLTVVAIPVASVAVTPSTLSLDPGESRALSAQPQASDGGSLPGRPVRWESRDPAIARVDQSGTVTAVGAGETTITVRSEVAAAEVRVTVVPETRAVLDGLVAAYAEALESGDIARIRQAYPGLTAEQSRDLQAALEGMRGLEAELSIGELIEQGPTATAQVAGTYRFINASNGRQQVVPISFTAVFERRGTSWVLTRTANN